MIAWGPGILALLAAALAAPVDVSLDARILPLPPGVPDAVVSAPRARPTTLVVYLHGWESCARAIPRSGPVDCGHGVVVPGAGLDAPHAAARQPTALVVPQLALLARSGRVGDWARPAAPSAWLAELKQRSPELASADRLVVVAHSGGYTAAAALLTADPPLPIAAVVLMDALYGRVSTFVGWVAGGPGRHLVSLHTAHPTTTARNRELAAAARQRLGDAAVRQLGALPNGDLTRTPVVVAHTPAPHGAVPAAHLEQVLRGLSRRIQDQPAR